MMADKKIADMSFEEAFAELELIVKNMEGGDAPLSDSVALYERGGLLKKHLEKILNDAKLKIEKVSVDEDGKVATVPFAPEA